MAIGIQSQYMPGLAYLFGIGLFDMLRLLLTVYWFALIVVIVLSFLAPGSYHPAAALLAQVTEPILAPARRLIPPLGGLDFSPILVFMILILVRDYLLPAIFTSLADVTARRRTRDDLLLVASTVALDSAVLCQTASPSTPSASSRRATWHSTRP